MQPLGNKILVRDIIEEEKKTQSGIYLGSVTEHYRKVKIEALSADMEEPVLKLGDICFANPGGVELEKGLWLCRRDLLDAIL